MRSKFKISNINKAVGVCVYCQNKISITKGQYVLLCNCGESTKDSLIDKFIYKLRGGK